MGHFGTRLVPVPPAQHLDSAVALGQGRACAGTPCGLVRLCDQPAGTAATAGQPFAAPALPGHFLGQCEGSLWEELNELLGAIVRGEGTGSCHVGRSHSGDGGGSGTGAWDGSAARVHDGDAGCGADPGGHTGAPTCLLDVRLGSPTPGSDSWLHSTPAKCVAGSQTPTPPPNLAASSEKKRKWGLVTTDMLPGGAMKRSFSATARGADCHFDAAAAVVWSTASTSDLQQPGLAACGPLAGVATVADRHVISDDGASPAFTLAPLTCEHPDQAAERLLFAQWSGSLHWSPSPAGAGGCESGCRAAPSCGGSAQCACDVARLTEPRVSLTDHIAADAVPASTRPAFSPRIMALDHGSSSGVAVCDGLPWSPSRDERPAVAPGAVGGPWASSRPSGGAAATYPTVIGWDGHRLEALVVSGAAAPPLPKCCPQTAALITDCLPTSPGSASAKICPTQAAHQSGSASVNCGMPVSMGMCALPAALRLPCASGCAPTLQASFWESMGPSAATYAVMESDRLPPADTLPTSSTSAHCSFAVIKGPLNWQQSYASASKCPAVAAAETRSEENLPSTAALGAAEQAAVVWQTMQDLYGQAAR
jgi:hypothetical protein